MAQEPVAIEAAMLLLPVHIHLDPKSDAAVEKVPPQEESCPHCRKKTLVFVAKINRSRRGPPWY